MLTIWGKRQKRFCDGFSRRDFLQVGMLGFGGLSLADLLRLKAQGAQQAESSHKSVIMIYLRHALPALDEAIYALVTDLYERGLDKDVTVVVWGEYGRTPKINNNAGRDHWPQASFALVAGGAFKMGQVIGATSPRAEQPVGGSYIPQNLLATLYREVFGIDPTTTLTDQSGRPIPLLDTSESITELV